VDVSRATSQDDYPAQPARPWRLLLLWPGTSRGSLPYEPFSGDLAAHTVDDEFAVLLLG
jgi:hypothetical protein